MGRAHVPMRAPHELLVNKPAILQQLAHLNNKRTHKIVVTEVRNIGPRGRAARRRRSEPGHGPPEALGLDGPSLRQVRVPA